MSDHIRTTGPHPHEWVVIYETEAARLQECALCGSRRITGHDPRFKGPPALAVWQRDWIAGADLPKEATP